MTDSVGPEPVDAFSNAHHHHRRTVRTRLAAASVLAATTAVIAVIVTVSGASGPEGGVTAVTQPASSPASSPATTTAPPQPTELSETQLAGSYADITGFRGGQQIVLRAIETGTTLRLVDVPAQWHVWSSDLAGRYVFALASRDNDIKEVDDGYAANDVQVLRAPMSGGELRPIGPAVSVPTTAQPLVVASDLTHGRVLFVRPDATAAVIGTSGGFVLVDLTSTTAMVSVRRDGRIATVFGWGPGPDDLLVEPIDQLGQTSDHVVRVVDVNTGASSRLPGVEGKVCAPMTAGGAAIVWMNCIDGRGSLFRVDDSGTHPIASMAGAGLPPYATVIWVSRDGRTARLSANLDCDIDEWTLDLTTGRTTLRSGDGKDVLCGAAAAIRPLPL